MALNGLEVEIDQFLQTDGNRKEIIAAFASGFFGGAQDTIKKLLGMAETSTTGWLQEKVGVPDAAKYTQPLFSSISQAVTQGLDQLKGNLPDQIDKIAMKAESQVTQAVTSNK